MEEISLTGATLTSHSENGDVKSGAETQPPAFEKHAHSHSHSHSHGGSEPCCEKKHNPLALPQIPTPVSLEKMVELPQEEVYKGVATLVRLGHFETLDPIVKKIVESDRTDSDAILTTLGEDGHSLLHWAAKRGK